MLTHIMLTHIPQKEDQSSRKAKKNMEKWLLHCQLAWMDENKSAPHINLFASDTSLLRALVDINVSHTGAINLQLQTILNNR